MAKQLLIDTLPIRASLIESDSGKIGFRGEFAKVDFPTANGRVYPRKLMEREIKRLGKKISERRLFGELDHPGDGKTQLQRAALVITKLEVKEDGQIYGEAEVLGTSKGRDLEALLRQGCTIGVSSRGYGSLAKNEEGHDVVQDDYTLLAFDAVADPADSTAIPEPFEVSKEETETPDQNTPEPEEDVPATDIRVENGEENASKVEIRDPNEISSEVMEAARKTLEANYRLLARLESDMSKTDKDSEEVGTQTDNNAPSVEEPQASSDLSENVEDSDSGVEESEDSTTAPEGEVASEPQASEVSEELGDDTTEILAAKEEEIQRLRKQLETLKEASKAVAFEYYLDKALRDRDDRDHVLKILGDPMKFSTVDDLQDRVQEVCEVFDSHRSDIEAAFRKEMEEREAEVDKVVSEVKAKFEAAAAREKDLLARIEELEEALDALKEERDRLAVQAHVAERLEGDPRARRLKALIEDSDIDTIEEADALLKGAEEAKTVNGRAQLEDIRSRVRSLMSSGFPEPDRVVVESEDTNYNGLNVSADELAALAGIKK